MLALPAFASAASLEGDTIDAYISAYGGRISGFGLDAPFVVTNGTLDTKTYSSAFKLNVDGTSFDIKFLLDAQFASDATLTLADLDFDVPNYILSNAVLNSNLTGYSFETGSDYLRINLGDVFIGTDKYIQGSFITSPVPEPSTGILAALGLGVLGIARMKI
jgi:hypothetical protein